MGDDTLSNVLWQKKRRYEISEAAATEAVIILPVGAIEQHGPHLPLDVDSWTAFQISVRAARTLRDGAALVLPPIWWGLSPYWMTFPGTISLRVETLVDVICDICASVEAHGFSRLIMLNGHGGNDGVLQGAAVRASQGSLRVATVSYWNLMPEAMRQYVTTDLGDAGHAGEMETSIQLALQADRVDLTALGTDEGLDLRKPVGPIEPGEASAIYLPPDPAREAPGGVYGKPAAASAEKGEALLTAAADGLARFLERFRVA